MITNIKDYTTEELEFFTQYRAKGLFSVEFTDDEKTVVTKKKFKATTTATGIPEFIEDGMEVIAHIDNDDYQSEIDNCLKRIELIRNFVEQEGISVE